MLSNHSPPNLYYQLSPVPLTASGNFCTWLASIPYVVHTLPVGLREVILTLEMRPLSTSFFLFELPTYFCTDYSFIQLLKTVMVEASYTFPCPCCVRLKRHLAMQPQSTEHTFVCSAGIRRYNGKLWKAFNNCFNCLPVAAIVGDKIFCCHSGLSPDLHEFQQIRKLARPTDVPDAGVWNWVMILLLTTTGTHWWYEIHP